MFTCVLDSSQSQALRIIITQCLNTNKAEKLFDVSYRKQLITCNKNNRVCGLKRLHM